jgi:prepilin-type processing-associated H-X9-DG protein
MASCLSNYLNDPRVLLCPCAPSPYPYLESAWKAGEAWDNPLTGFADDPVFGNYCFYWNYLGYVESQKGPMIGPGRSTGGRGQGSVLVSDYMGYDHHLSPKAYASCQPFQNASVIFGTEVSSDVWAGPTQQHDSNNNRPHPRLNAGFIDGHVESYTIQNTIIMDVAMSSDGRIPYPRGMEVGPGVFLIPQAALSK